ncbi:MAG TPA: hypothetical protein VN955_01480 [Gemmatimonadales bacterium]|nr:hypothetical protein [Gemmatimonadales bacterium]
MLAPLFLPRLLALWWGALQGAPIDGTWELARIFRPGPASASRAVPIDSTVYVRLTLTTMPGDWIGGRLYRRYYGKEERSKIEAGPLGRTGRYIIGADLDYPASQKARTAAWLVGDALRLGTPFVPDADSLELRRVRADAPYPTTVLDVVTSR